MFIFFVRRSGAGHYYNKFPFRFVHGKVRNQFFDCSPACLLETFREFARKGSPPFFSEEFSQLRQCFKNPVGRFVEDDAPFFGGQCTQTRLSSFLRRQESFEAKAVGRQSRYHKCRHESCGSRQTFHLRTLTNAFAHEQEARIGDARCARIGDQRDVFASYHPFDNLFHRPVFVELVM